MCCLIWTLWGVRMGQNTRMGSTKISPTSPFFCWNRKVCTMFAQLWVGTKVKQSTFCFHTFWVGPKIEKSALFFHTFGSDPK